MTFRRLVALTLIPTLIVPLGYVNVALAADAPGGTRVAAGREALQRQVEGLEYRVTWQEGTALDDLPAAWQAPNRAHGLRTYFAEEGIRIVPRTATAASAPAWDWGLKLTGIGRGVASSSVVPAAPAAKDNRVLYTRGELVEWYVNDRNGLKQGFDLATPPIGTPDATGHPAAIVLEIRGSLDARLSADGQAVDLFAPPIPVAVGHYAGLHVIDSNGTTLPSWMELVERSGVRTLKLLYDDRDAIYPVTVDPLLKAEAWAVEGNQTGAKFGFAVATAGDVNDDGYDDVIVGVPAFDAGQPDEGRAFVFHGSPSGLESFPAWTAEIDQDGAAFGYAVAGAGDVNDDGFADVIVGARLYDNDFVDEGAAFVYYGSAAGLASSPAWSVEGDQADAQLGGSVDGAGDVDGNGYDDVIVGARLFDNGDPDEGIALVYYSSAAGLSGGPDAGRSDADWAVEGGKQDATLGNSVAAAGDVNGDGYADVIVGAPFMDVAGDNRVGQAWVYVGSSGGLSLTADWTMQGGEANTYFGQSVASAGDVDGDGYDDVIVGASRYDQGGEPDEGAAAVYYGSAAGISARPPWFEESDIEDARFGSAVNRAGDVNGDGYDDVVAAAPGYAKVYLGSATGVDEDPAWSVDRAAGEGERSVGTAGDVNGDGYADLIVGSALFDGDKVGEGRARVFHGAVDATASDLAEGALERLVLVCDANADNTNATCSVDADCPNGSCTSTVATAGSGVWSDALDPSVPDIANPPQDDVATAAIYFGSRPNSVIISTGLAQDEGRGDTDWGQDGDPDLVRWRLSLRPPEGARTLRFTTQFITSDIQGGTSRDTVRMAIERLTSEGTTTVSDKLNGVSGLGVREINSPVDHGIRVDDINDLLTLTFEVADGTDGSLDSALIVSDMYFSSVPLPDGADTDQAGEAPPDYLANPSPRDTGYIAGTFAFEETLYSIPGIGLPFEFSVSYNSASVAESRSLGPKWTHSYEASLQKALILEGGVPVELVIVRLGNGYSEYFRCDQTTCTTGGTYTSTLAGNYSTLTQTADGDGTAAFEYETRDHVTYTYDLDLDYVDGNTADPYETFALTQIKDIHGNEINLSYTNDAEERIDTIVDTRGKLFTFNYNADGLLSSIENPQGGGAGVTFSYEAAVVDGELENLLVAFTDLNGLPTTFTYDDRGNILTATDGDGRTFLTNDYEQFTTGAGEDAVGDRVVLRRSANPWDLGEAVVYTGEAVETTGRAAGKLVDHYDARGRLHSRELFLGSKEDGAPCDESDYPECWAVAEVSYGTICQGGTNAGDPCDTDSDCLDGTCGSTGNPVWMRDPRGHITELEYDARGNETLRHDDVTVDSVVETVYTESLYDAEDNLLYRAIRPVTEGITPCLADPGFATACNDISGSECYVEAFCYDANNNLTQEYDSEGDPAPTPVTCTADMPAACAANDSVLHVYNAMGQEIEERDRNGNWTEYEHDPDGNLIKIIGPPADGGRPVTEREHDEFGRVTLTRTLPEISANPLDHETTYDWDPGGRLIGTTNALSETTSYSYDSRDRMLSMTLADQSLVTWDYTPSGRLEREAVPLGLIPDGECVGGPADGGACDEDADCSPPSGPPSGRCAVVITYSYDLDDRLIAETDNLGRSTDYTCDAADRLIGVEDPEGGTVTARYDKAGLLLGFDDPRSNETTTYTTTYEYDERGRLTRETDPLSYTVETEYDERDLVKSVVRARGGNNRLDYEYDKPGRLTKVVFGAPAWGQSGRAEVTHELDNNGNRTTTDDTQFGGVGEGAIVRTFDAHDRLKTRTDPFGNTIAYEYDLAGNVTSLCYDWNGSACVAGSEVTYAYDALNRLTRVTDWADNETTYAYDAVGNLTSTTLPDGKTITLGYDEGRRLVSVDGAFYQASLERNAAGSITAADETLPLDPASALTSGVETVDTFTYDAANRLNNAGYDHDDDGNMTEGVLVPGEASVSLVYDELNRLVEVDGDPIRYDADGMRVEVTRGAAVTRYLFDPNSERPRLLAEYDDQGNLLARYVHGLGLISREEPDHGPFRVYHYDLRGSTVALTDGGGGVTDRYAYDPFGALVDEAHAGIPTPTPFLYSGRDGVFDDGNGLNFMRTRYYAPELRRFIQKDQLYSGALADTQSLNRYAYVMGDPIRFVDPDGQFLLLLIVAPAAAVIAYNVIFAAALVAIVAFAIFGDPSNALLDSEQLDQIASGLGSASLGFGLVGLAVFWIAPLSVGLGIISAIFGIVGIAFAIRANKVEEYEEESREEEAKKSEERRQSNLEKRRNQRLARWAANALQTELNAPATRSDRRILDNSMFGPPGAVVGPPGWDGELPPPPEPCLRGER